MDGLFSRRKDTLNSLVKDCYEFCSSMSTCLEATIRDIDIISNHRPSRGQAESAAPSRGIVSHYFSKKKKSKITPSKTMFSNNCQSHPNLDLERRGSKKEVTV